MPEGASGDSNNFNDELFCCCSKSRKSIIQSTFISNKTCLEGILKMLNSQQKNIDSFSCSILTKAEIIPAAQKEHLKWFERPDTPTGVLPYCDTFYSHITVVYGNNWKYFVFVFSVSVCML